MADDKRGIERVIRMINNPSITFDQVLAALKRKDSEMRIPYVRLAVDYELLTLYDAIQADDTTQIEQSKAILNELRREFIMLEV